MFNLEWIKQTAKNHYHARQGDTIIAALIPVLFSLVYSALGSYFGLFINIFFRKQMVETFKDQPDNFFDFLKTFIVEFTPYLIGVYAVLYLFSLLIIIFFSNNLTLGVQGWFLRSVRGEFIPGSQVFWTFKNGNYFSILKTAFLKQFFIFLWSLLFIVPGFIKYYSYYAVEFIKTENPCLSSSRCLEISKIMTDGHKNDLLYLDASFLGWLILSMFTYNIVGIIYVFPYYYSARALAYINLRELAISSGKLTENDFHTA